MPSEPANEKERLAALREYQILDTEAKPEFDEIAALAAEICQVPFSTITLIDQERSWFKSSVNFPLREMPRESSLFEQAILFPNKSLVVTDLQKDERFKNLPFVKQEPHIVFFSGVPLINPGGYILGMLCVMDKRPGKLSDSQLRILQILARQVVHLLELRKASLRIKILKHDLESHNEESQQFAYTVSHDIKSPLASIILTNELLRENFGDHLDEDNDQLLKVLSRSSLKIKNIVEGSLAYYRSGVALAKSSESVELKPFLFSIAELFNENQSADIHLPDEDRSIFINKTALEQILVNLVQNAIKHNDKNRPDIQILFSEDPSHYHFTVIDNGKGIKSEQQKKLLELFSGPTFEQRFEPQDSHIGLSIVKRLVEKLSGKMVMKSVPGKGSEFSFSLKKEK